MKSGLALEKPLKGQERSFAKEVRALQLGDGDAFHGEGVLAVTKALLQSGVAYVGGYPGAPVSHLIDVLADASAEILEPMGIQFEQSASEAGAAALLGASINYPLRGAVTWKSVVGTNVAADGLSNLASSGVVGGALIIIGEDYGEGASIIQERSHAYAMKSSIPLIDPRYDLQTMVDLTEHAFELSEAAHLPVFFNLRIRACHMTGSFRTKDNKAPPFSPRSPLPRAEFDINRIVLPPATYAQEKAKFDERLPAARAYIQAHGLNETFPGAGARFGIVTQGGTHSVVMRGLRMLGAADTFGASDVAVLVLNVIHPLVPDEIEGFLADKDDVLVVEEGNPAFIESQIAEMAHKAEIPCRVHGKGMLPMAGEYVADVVRDGLAKFLEAAAPEPMRATAKARAAEIAAAAETARAHLADPMPPRPPSFCTGCPERPIMAALKLIMDERGPLHVSMDIGCSTFGSLPPFNLGSTVLGYGMGLASGGAVGPALGQPTVAVMGDGAFWHNGLTTGVINAQWNKYDSVLIVLDNGYAAATGQHHIPSTGSTPRGKPSKVTIEQTLRGMGIDWIEHVDSYSLEASIRVLKKALDARGQGIRVVLSNNECMLARQRRERPARADLDGSGKPVVEEKFGVDAEVCTGDHSCMRLSGCPSLTLRPSPDPLMETPIAHVDESCVACGHCGEVAHAAQLCPSFYKAQGMRNPSPFRRMASGLNRALLSMMGA